MSNKTISNIGHEITPLIFSTPRFTFPFSLVGRPLQVLDCLASSAILWDHFFYTNDDAVVRDEFFGAVVYKDVKADEGKFGYLRFINIVGREILRLCNGTRTGKELMDYSIQNLGIDQDEFIQFAARCISSEIIDVKAHQNKILNIIKSNKKDKPKYKISRLTSPLRLYLNITKRCNMKCSHCYAKLDKKIIELDLSIIDNVTNDIEHLKIPTVVLTGGEPLLAKDFPYIIKKMRQKKISCFINTNGLALNFEYIKQLSEAGLNIIAVSVDGANPEKHNKIRGKGMFERTVANIRKSVEMGLDVSMSIALTAESVENIDEFIKLGVDNGVCDFHFMLFVPVGRGEGVFSKVPKLSQILRLREKLLFNMSTYPEITFNCTGVVHNKLLQDWHLRFKDNSIASYIYSGCEAGRFRYEVGFDGSYIPCVLLDYESFRKGHASSLRLKESWDQLPYTLQKMKFNERKLHNDCGDCEALIECAGGCRGITYARYKGLDYRDPTCKRINV